MSRIKIALAQFFVKEAGEENLAVVKDLIARADEAGASLLVLPKASSPASPASPAGRRIMPNPSTGPS